MNEAQLHDPAEVVGGGLNTTYRAICRLPCVLVAPRTAPCACCSRDFALDTLHIVHAAHCTTPCPGMQWRGGGGSHPSVQGAQHLPSHYLSDGKCQLQ